MGDRAGRPICGRGLTLPATCAVILLAARAGTPELHVEGRGDGPWRIGEPVAIAVREGKSTFQLPPRGEGAQTLVVVSALSRHPGPFPIRLEARPVARALPPECAAHEAARPPRLTPHRPEPLPPPSARAPLARRDFHMMVRDGDVSVAGNYLRVRGVLRAVGRRVQVYVGSDDLAQVDAAMLSDVVSTFDERIVPAAAGAVGLAGDVDGDGRFTVLLSSWLNRLGDGRHAVDGFVRVTDLDPSFSPPFGNRCDMMYLSTSLKPGAHLRTVLAHEYMHAVVFSKKMQACAGKLPMAIEEEGWLDEAIAHLFEDAIGFSRSNIDYRISAYLSQPDRYQLVVDDYYAADLFRSHGNRGSTYLFLRWCVEQYGPDLIPTLIRTPARGVANLEQATGCTFGELYRRWSVAQFRSGMEPDRPAGAGLPAGPVAAGAGGEEWPLAGPHPCWLEPGDRPDSWEAAGTSSRYVLIPGRKDRAVEVTVAGPPDAVLQVTAVPLPADLGRLELSVRPTSSADGEVRLLATVRQAGGLPIRLRTLAWEPLVPPPNPHTPGFHLGRLDEERLEPVLGALSPPASGSIRSRPIVLPGVHPGSGPVVLKLIGLDARGRRVSAWAILDSRPAPSEPGDARPLATRTR
ncbi:MAG: hypothetical protein U0790_28165 [Isosphaeraceae bacterium]